MRLMPRRPLPQVGDLVVGTVEEIHEYGAYLSLDEYGGARAFLPWSEVATRAVRRIEDVLKEGQKVVVKVIRVYRGRGEVDVSLKRVMSGERRRKMALYKRYVKAATIIEMIAERMGRGREEAYKEVIWKLEDAYGDPMSGLEAIVMEGEEALEGSGIGAEWRDALVEAAKSHVQVRAAKISGVFTLRSTASDGVERVKSVLVEAKSLVQGRGEASLRLYSIGSPKYRIDLQGRDYKALEKLLSSIVKAAERRAKSLGVEFSFERIRG